MSVKKLMLMVIHVSGKGCPIKPDKYPNKIKPECFGEELLMFVFLFRFIHKVCHNVRTGESNIQKKSYAVDSQF